MTPTEAVMANYQASVELLVRMILLRISLDPRFRTRR